MKRALWSFTLAALLSTSALAAAPLPAAPACPVPDGTAAVQVVQVGQVAQAPEVLFAADATAPKVAKCPRPGINCPDVYDPVICSNGKVYSNSCYAYVACATGCVSY